MLELANNHWGSLCRGKQIIKQFATVAKRNNVAAIKLQFRDVKNFIHKDYLNEGKGAELTDLPKKQAHTENS